MVDTHHRLYIDYQVEIYFLFVREERTGSATLL